MAGTYCPVCGQRDSWGCGHTGSQRSAARRQAIDTLERFRPSPY